MERRRAVRRVPSGHESLTRVRLRTGPELSVRDISDVGALVEGAVRLLPGARLDIHVIARDGRVLVRSRVVRAQVSTICAEGVRYRGAIAFDQPVDTAPVQTPTDGLGIPAVRADGVSGLSRT
jgi:hypothetical protein